MSELAISDQSPGEHVELVECVACGCTDTEGCAPARSSFDTCFWTSSNPPLCSECFRPLLGTELAVQLAEPLVAEALAVLREYPGGRLRTPAMQHAHETIEFFGIPAARNAADLFPRP